MIIKLSPYNRYGNKKYMWRWWFAWYPVELEDGEYLWLESICRRRNRQARTSEHWEYGNRKVNS